MKKMDFSMKAIKFLSVFFFLSLLSVFFQYETGWGCFSQTYGKSKIVMKDKTVLNNIKIWNIYSNKIEYEEKESLHDLATDKIARIENDTAVLSFDETGQLFSRPYDWIVKTNGDSILCVISQLGGNYIYYYPKGRETRSYIPESSVKHYQVYKPELQKKLEPGTAPRPEPASIAPPETPLQPLPSALKADTLPLPKADSGSTAKIDTTAPPVQNVSGLPEKKVNEEQNNPAIPAPTDVCYESYLKGQQDANKKNETAWGAFSFCTNSCLCGIPASALTLAALQDKGKPREIPAGMDEKCYLLGYKNQRAKRRTHNIAVGGIFSAVVLAAVYFVSLYPLAYGGI